MSSLVPQSYDLDVNVKFDPLSLMVIAVISVFVVTLIRKGRA